MRQLTLKALPIFFLFATGLLGCAPTEAPRDVQSSALNEASRVMNAAFEGTCTDRGSGQELPLADAIFEIRYRYSWQDEAEPESVVQLYQMHCYLAAYNSGEAYLLKRGDDSFEVLSFAEPIVEYEYADEEQTRLSTSPVVTGYVGTTILTNSTFDPETGSIGSFAKWRGIGDAWSAGTWVFEEGRFVLTRYAVDPTWSANGPQDLDGQMDEESYEIYPEVRVSGSR